MRILVILSVFIALTTRCTNQSPVAEPETDVEYTVMVQRATQCALWAMPAVGIYGFKKAIERDVKGQVNDIAYLSKPLSSRHGFLTANDVTNYSLATLNNEAGPLVLEVPPAGEKVSYFGTIVNAWDQPIEDVGPPGADKGLGGKYLFVPPGYEGELPKEGYYTYFTDTYDMCIAFRPILKNGGNYDDAAEYAKGLKVYPLSQENDPPATRHLDAFDTDFDCLPYYDYSFWEDVNAVVQRNPVRVQDKVMINLLKSLGIEKGEEMRPTENQKKAMMEGLDIAWTSMQNYFTTEGKSMVPLWNGRSNWQVWNFAQGQAQAGFPYETEEEILIDDRAGGSYFWITFLPKYLGGGTFYLTALRDGEENLLNGSGTYKLNIPADSPAEDFWSVIVYSMKTKGFVRNAERVGISSRELDALVKNDDGSVDVFFAPEPPDGIRSNWIPTGEDFFLLFRLYGPKKDFQKDWVLSPVERVRQD